MESITSISTSLSARSLTVHFDLPSGGSEQARRVNCASILPSILGGAPLRAFSCSAKSKPPSQYLFLIRLTVDLLTFNASAIVSSSHPSSAKRSILARVRLLAELAFAKILFQIVSFLFFQADNVQFLPSHDIYLISLKFKTLVTEH